MSVDTLEEAESLLTLAGEMMYSRYNVISLVKFYDEDLKEICDPYKPTTALVPTGPRLIIKPVSGFKEHDLESIEPAGNWLEDLYQRVVRKPKVTHLVEGDRAKVRLLDIQEDSIQCGVVIE